MERSHVNVGADLDSTARRFPRHPAIITADGVLGISYEELAEATSAISERLRREGVRPGDRVGIVQFNSWRHVSTWYAVLRVGAVCVDLNTALSAGQWTSMLDDSGAHMVLGDAGTVDKLAVAASAAAGPVRVIAVDDVPASETGASHEPYPSRSEDLAVIAYTSGTTGLPKGVMHSHGGLQSELALLRDACGFDHDWHVYVSIPLFSLHGFLPQVAVTMSVGGTIVMATKFDAAAFAAATRRFPISYTTLSSPMVPALMQLSDAEAPDLRSMQILSCGGAPLHPSIREAFTLRFGAHLTEGYSMTEVMGAFVMDIDGDAPYGASGRAYPRGDPPVMRIQDDDGHPLPPQTPGEIAFRRSSALVGYWPDQFKDGGDGWFPTGDIGRIDTDGFLYLLDRKKDVILRGGFTIYSAEIERVLILDPSVSEATVVGVPDERLGEVAVAYVVPEPNGAAPGLANRLIEAVREALGALKAPSRVEIVEYENLPRNAVGKVIKPDLRRRARSEQASSSRK
jgi:long-chain acyl-CoA synthetase